MKIVCIRLFAAVLFCVSVGVRVYGGDPVYLNEAYCHKGRLSDKLSFYFSGTPECVCLPLASYEVGKKKDGWKEVRLHLPMASIAKNDVRKSLYQMNRGKNSFYEVSCYECQAPKKGVMVSIRYNPQEIAVEYAPFTSIGQKGALLIALNKRQFIYELNKKTAAIHHIAWNDKKKIHIVLDIGHGGADRGKVGWFDIQEKDINLAVGFKVAKLLSKKGFSVSMTRSDDQFVSLDDRTTFANTKAQADLFISLHSNSGPETASGIETFCVQDSCLPHVEQIDDFTPSIEARNCWYKQSALLAQSVHEHVIQSARLHTLQVKDRQVKRAMSQVLLGTDMPSALIEMGFLSNEQEAKRLASQTYQNHLARGICAGIESYIKRLDRIF
ncbi:N-acetylmuramoyl-L-alanine amidase [Candidatus Babeliales bacterium]|nr:N-acetylmuramoyl-L-alanine amidase [Candidatus Babeliales bacterium]